MKRRSFIGAFGALFSAPILAAAVNPDLPVDTFDVTVRPNNKIQLFAQVRIIPIRGQVRTMSWERFKLMYPSAPMEDGFVKLDGVFYKVEFLIDHNKPDFK